MAFAAVVAGKAITLPGFGPAEAIALAVVAATLTGVFCGFLNGAISAYWSLPSFIITLGMLNIARGAALQVSEAQTIYSFPFAFEEFGSAMVYGVPVVFLVALLLVFIAWFVLNFTVFGRLIYGIGNNEEAVRLAGHSVARYKIAAFTICGLTAGIAAVVYMARLNISSPIAGIGFELNAIAAVIIGGTSPQRRARIGHRDAAGGLHHRCPRQRAHPDRPQRFHAPDDHRCRHHRCRHPRLLPCKVRIQMKRTALLNRHLSSLVASLGHLDEIVVADAGLPVPAGVKVIDLAVTAGVPSFRELLTALKSELVIEGAVWAEEASAELTSLMQHEVASWAEETGKAITVSRLTHEAFKHRTQTARAVIRTGEVTPYANIILISGVAF